MAEHEGHIDRAHQPGHMKREGHPMDDETSLTVETVGHETDTHAYRLQLTGELDLASAPLLITRVEECIAVGAKLVIIDAADVEFIDSSGLRAIISAGNLLADTGGRLLIDGVSGAVQQVLEISGLIDRYRQTADE
jgi:anti-anti-sigma factor